MQLGSTFIKYEFTTFHIYLFEMNNWLQVKNKADNKIDSNTK